MERERIGVCSRVRMRGLRNRAMVEVSQDAKRGDYVLVMSKGIRKKWLLFNLPEEMWRVRGSKEEVLDEVEGFLAEKI